jgi:hypothetical protein
MPYVYPQTVPDSFGGLIVIQYATCLPNQTQPMSISDIDGVSGTEKWHIEAAGTQSGYGTQYCYSAATVPLIAVRRDGTAVLTEPTNSGLPPVTLVNPYGGTRSFLVPGSTFESATGQPIGAQCCVGPPMVDSDGTTYYQYEVRYVDKNNIVTSDDIYINSINAQNQTSSDGVLLRHTQNEVQTPGRIIPDGQGGVLATWGVQPMNAPLEQYPYHAARFAGGVVGTSFNIPLSVTSVAPFPYQSPQLVLGQNATAFASQDRYLASFTLNGANNWSYQAASGHKTSLIASTIDDGVVAKDTDPNGNENVLTFDSSGALAGEQWSGSGIDYFVGNIWTGFSPAGAGQYRARGPQLPTTGWYEPTQSGSNRAPVNLTVTNASQSEPNETVIADVLKKLRTALDTESTITNPPTCSEWLTSAYSSVFDALLGTTSYPGYHFGHGTFSNNTVAAFKFGQNPDGSSVGVPSDYAITVNDGGAFFSDSYEVGIRKYKGGTLSARATILIHEIAHILSNATPGWSHGGADDFQNDNNNDKAEKWNDKLVDRFCKELIEGLR